MLKLICIKVFLLTTLCFKQFLGIAVMEYQQLQKETNANPKKPPVVATLEFARHVFMFYVLILKSFMMHAQQVENDQEMKQVKQLSFEPHHEQKLPFFNKRLFSPTGPNHHKTKLKIHIIATSVTELRVASPRPNHPHFPSI